MKKDQDSSYIGASFASILLHIVLVGGLLLGIDITSKTPPPSGRSIEAVIIDPAIVSAKADQIRHEREAKKRQEQDRLKRLDQKAKSLKKQQAEEEKRLRELRQEKRVAEKAAREAEIKRKRLAAEKQKAEREAKEAEKAKQQRLYEKRKADAAAKKADEKRRIAEEKQREAQAQEKAAEIERQKKIAEKKRAEKAAKKAEEERQRSIERKRKAEQEAKEAEAIRKEAERKAEEAKRKKIEQEALLGELFSGLESESEIRTSARGQQINDEVSRWASRYVNIIQQNWIVDDSHENVTCLLNLQLTSDGLVFNVEKVSGSELLCRSAKASIFKISQFPVPSDPLVMDKLKNINLKFEP